MDEVATVTRTPPARRRRERIHRLSFAGPGSRRAAEGLRRPELEVKLRLRNPHDQRPQVRLSDFLILAALDSSACRSSPDISGSKVRTTPSRPTMLGSDSVTPNFSL